MNSLGVRRSPFSAHGPRSRAMRAMDQGLQNIINIIGRCLVTRQPVAQGPSIEEGGHLLGVRGPPGEGRGGGEPIIFYTKLQKPWTFEGLWFGEKVRAPRT